MSAPRGNMRSIPGGEIATSTCDLKKIDIWMNSLLVLCVRIENNRALDTNDLRGQKK